MSPPTVLSSLRQNGLAHQALGLLLAMRKMRWRGGQWVAGPFCAFPPSEARSQPWHSLFLPLLWKVEALGPDFPPSREEGRVRTGGRVNRPGGVGNWWVGGNWAHATKGRVLGKGNNPLRRPTWELIWKRKQTEDSVAKKKKEREMMKVIRAKFQSTQSSIQSLWSTFMPCTVCWTWSYSKSVT